jgi:hypothetical protein
VEVRSMEGLGRTLCTQLKAFVHDRGSNVTLGTVEERFWHGTHDLEAQLLPQPNRPGIGGKTARRSGSGGSARG